jgi:hypothetical protein
VEALKPNIVAEIEKRFRLATPLVNFLNAPLVQTEKPRRVLISALPRK